MEILNSNFFSNNRKKLIEKLPEGAIAFIISNDLLPRNGDQSFKFRQNSDLFYFTGINQQNSILVINKAHPSESYREILFIEKVSEAEEIWTGKRLTPEQAKDISGMKQILFTHEFQTILGELMYYAEEVFINNNEYPAYQRFFNDREYRFIENLKFRFPVHTYRRLYPIITELRLIKENEEIEAIKKSIQITSKALQKIFSAIKPGMYEYEIEAEIIYEFRKNNADHAYLPIVACGKNGAILHYIENNCQCKDGDLVLLDFGAEFENYAADLSRTIPINGKFSLEQKKIYNAVLEAMNFAKRLMKPGITIREITNHTGKFIGEQLQEIGLLSKKEITKNTDAYKKFFMHGIGHFLGLDVHDAGTKDLKLQPGMILTCEPGIYLKDKLGIRLENNILITKEGNIDLTQSIPLEVEEIEDAIIKSKK